MQGNDLQSPIRTLKKRRGVPLRASLRQLLTPAEIQRRSATALNRRIREALDDDECRWQQSRGIEISQPWRGEGLEPPLYQCPNCLREYEMGSKGSRLFCGHCGSVRAMTVSGALEALRGAEAVEAPAEQSKPVPGIAGRVAYIYGYLPGHERDIFLPGFGRKYRQGNPAKAGSMEKAPRRSPRIYANFSVVRLGAGTGRGTDGCGRRSFGHPGEGGSAAQCQGLSASGHRAAGAGCGGAFP